ncbi:hypothetical protein KW882_01240 [Vibrio parahaemolyticus]
MRKFSLIALLLLVSTSAISASISVSDTYQITDGKFTTGTQNAAAGMATTKSAISTRTETKSAAQINCEKLSDTYSTSASWKKYGDETCYEEITNRTSYYWSGGACKTLVDKFSVSQSMCK